MGVIGCNEEDGLRRLLASLGSQTLLVSGSVEVVVVSNGSTDQTAAVARELGATFRVPFRVEELPEGDKCAAWNHLVHGLGLRPDLWVLLDADVTLLADDALSALVAELEAHPECRILSPVIVNPRGEPIGRHVDGKCYAARGSALADVAIPRGVVMDDTFVAVTLVTDWYATGFDEGMAKGFVRRLERTLVRYGETPRDRDKAYWLSVGRRTLIGTWVQAEADHLFREVLGGGPEARRLSMDLFRANPEWFWKALLHRPSRLSFRAPPVRPGSFPKDLVKVGVALYAWLLARRGIATGQLGRLAWRLPHRWW